MKGEELIHSSHKTLGLNPLRRIPALLQSCAPGCPCFWKTFITPFLSKTLSFSPQWVEAAQTSGVQPGKQLWNTNESNFPLALLSLGVQRMKNLDLSWLLSPPQQQGDSPAQMDMTTNAAPKTKGSSGAASALPLGVSGASKAEFLGPLL